MHTLNEDSAEMIAKFANLPMEVQRRLLRNVDSDSTLSKSSGLYKTGTDELIIGWHELVHTGLINMNGTFVTKCSRQIPVGDLLLSNGASAILPEAFEDCTSLTSLIFPPSVVDIRNNAFEGCSRLGSVTFFNSVVSIGDRAFYGCSRLTSVILPASVQSIGKEAFAGCKGMAYAIISDGIREIGERAFYGDTNLTRIFFPTSVTQIGAFAIGANPDIKAFCAVPEDLKGWDPKWCYIDDKNKLDINYGYTRSQYEAKILTPAGNPRNGGY